MLPRSPALLPCAPWPVRDDADPWLHDTAASRQLEAWALGRQPRAGELMARAGLSVARLAQTLIRPGPGPVVVLCGPGHNGGDGLVAARLLHAQGRAVRVVLSADPARLPDDARAAWQAAREAGVPMAETPPDGGEAVLIIDALLGLGQQRPPEGTLAQAVAWAMQQSAPILAVDQPTGLEGDSGRRLGDTVIRATATLSLLSLKPGLFTGQGRAHAGQVWLDRLGVDPWACPTAPPTARLTGPRLAARSSPRRCAGDQKGSHGDLWLLAGAPGMTGAAWLAARAGLQGGAGRVYVSLLDPQALLLDPQQPELMARPASAWHAPGVLENATVVCGCGGGETVAAQLPEVLDRSARLVLDADALNAVARVPALRDALRRRSTRQQPSVLTPHPLEAARLAGVSVDQLQADRLGHAQALAEDLGCVVLLKGSGTVVAAPGLRPWVNASGHAGLATPGSGDVLAGWLGARWSSTPTPTLATLGPAGVSAAAAWLHGHAAECWQPQAPRLPLPASALIGRMADALLALADDPEPPASAAVSAAA